MWRGRGIPRLRALAASDCAFQTSNHARHLARVPLPRLRAHLAREVSARSRSTACRAFPCERTESPALEPSRKSAIPSQTGLTDGSSEVRYARRISRA